MRIYPPAFLIRGLAFILFKIPFGFSLISLALKLPGTPVCYTGALQVIFVWHKVDELYVREDTKFI